MWENFANILQGAGSFWDGFTAWWNSLNWEQIKEAFTVGCGAISAILTVIVIILRRSGNQAKIKTADKIASFNSIVRTSICEAETYKSYTGEQKKAYALAKIQAECKKHNIDFSKDEINDAIEALIAVSNKVNTHKK